MYYFLSTIYFLLLYLPWYANIAILCSSKTNNDTNRDNCHTIIFSTSHNKYIFPLFWIISFFLVSRIMLFLCKEDCKIEWCRMLDLNPQTATFKNIFLNSFPQKQLGPKWQELKIQIFIPMSIVIHDWLKSFILLASCSVAYTLYTVTVSGNWTLTCKFIITNV